MYWFYVDSKGRPVLVQTGDGSGIDMSDDNKVYDELVAKTIKSKTYLFDAAGRMRSGLFQLTNVAKGNGANPLDGYYYFTEDDAHGATDGQMVTNKRMTLDVNGEDQTYYFDKTGKAYTNMIISSSFYGNDGALVDGFGDGSTYARVAVSVLISKGFLAANDQLFEKGKTTAVDLTPVADVDAGETYVLLNGNGKIKKSGTTTDVDSMKVTVKDYVVTKVEDRN